MIQREKNKMFSVGFALLFGVYFALAPPLTASAAEIYFDNKNQEIRVGDQFEVGVFINTDEESINAIEGKIIFPQDLLEIKKINDGNSIINFWIEKPKSLNKLKCYHCLWQGR